MLCAEELENFRKLAPEEIPDVEWEEIVRYSEKTLETNKRVGIILFWVVKQLEKYKLRPETLKTPILDFYQMLLYLANDKRLWEEIWDWANRFKMTHFLLSPVKGDFQSTKKDAKKLLWKTKVPDLKRFAKYQKMHGYSKMRKWKLIETMLI